MAIYIEMPKLSDTMTEGTLLKWRKNEGDKIETGDVLAEIETDKATMEMEAFDDGILHKHLVAAGGKVAVGRGSGCFCRRAKRRPPMGPRSRIRRSPPPRKPTPSPRLPPSGPVPGLLPRLRPPEPAGG